MSYIFALLLGFAILWLACKLLKISLKVFWKLLTNAIVGAAVLFILNFIGISISITFLSALIVGVLGVPGVILLLIFM